ncbi:extracellular solute-binding protein [Paenibacillus mesophilus]|uniref:ABC transporter substrate-binding protein n=1 Tax=Paenibacillus mesophilus TaxID=2582849 RepID=UPI00110E01CE|nr:extracellular solute-binding protein [Paenibacillus mesophilus]TMV47865.1 extracellular solute-binding protein [Paenibacillus mesophilus]
MKKSIAVSTASIMIALTVSACGGDFDGNKEGSKTPDPTTPPSPVTLVFLVDGAAITDEEIEKLVKEPIKAKYPHITVEYRGNTRGNTGLGEMIGAGDFPDFVLTTYPRITIHRDLGTTYDLTELVKKYKVDLTKFDPQALETARMYGSKDKVYALPFSLNFLATFYNKDLFDMFGVEYPKEGLTWDDTLSLAKRMTRMSDNVQYRGLFTNGLLDLSTQLSLAYVNPTTGKANVQTEGWKKVFQLVKDINDIPGNMGGTGDHFLKEQSVAMVTGYDARIAALEALHGTPGQFNWDLTQFPSYKERPNTSLASSGHFLIVSALSKHKEEAFQAIQVLTGVENQKLMTSRGRFTALNDPEIKEMYGSGMKSLQGKNVKSVFKSNFASPFTASSVDALVQPSLNAAIKKVNEDIMDINSALREAEDIANKEIDAKKGK